MSKTRNKISFFNSLTKAKEEFVPLEKNKVTVYSCGPTVYDSSHIGHARSFIVWDVLIRFLRAEGFDVQWARNITDIDDKIINRSQELGLPPEKLARMETFKFWKDMNDINVQWPDFEPRATEFLENMFDFIQGLENKGFAYRAQNGDVYFKVEAFEKYGQLKNLAKQNENISRIEHKDCKDSNCDFALWKGFSENEHGYLSPFGHGRPGWHLECSTMIKALFGETIDIHTGGEDLMFPHHENEITQSEALHNKQFVKYWLHNGMIMVNGKKMSKSEGNFITIAESLKKYSGNAIRLFVLNAHYRQPINYTEEALTAAENGFTKLIGALEGYVPNDKNPVDEELNRQFSECMADDLNTACALAILFEVSKRINKGEKNLQKTLHHFLSVLGFKISIHSSKNNLNSENLQPVFELLLEMREKARLTKDFALADTIRKRFEDAGFQIEDSPQGSKIVGK
jgi:cysteinyl-tRNA synthetase